MHYHLSDQPFIQKLTNNAVFQDRVYVKNNKVDEVQDLGLKLFKELVSSAGCLELLKTTGLLLL